MKNAQALVPAWPSTGSACPACTQAKAVLDRFHVAHEDHPMSAFPRRFGAVRSMPQITIDGQLLGGVNQLLKLARSGGLEQIAEDDRAPWSSGFHGSRSVRTRRGGDGEPYPGTTPAGGIMGTSSTPTSNGSRRHRVVVVGSSFAGLTAALEAKKRLKDRADVTVIDQRDYFTFVPSLIWVPFGKRDGEDITFPLAPMYERRGITFLNATAERFDLDRQTVVTDHGEIAYDRLVIATGPRLAFEKIPGLGPEQGHTQSVCTLDHAMKTRECVAAVPREPRAGRRRHRAGRILLRRLVRVPAEHATPAREGRSRGSPGHVHHRRAVPRPFRPRRGGRLGEARREVLRQARHPRHPQHHHRLRQRTARCGWEAERCCRSGSR